MSAPTRVVVVGGGMVGARFAADLVARDAGHHVTLLGAEEHEPYNRVLLSEVVAGAVDVAGLALPGADAGLAAGRFDGRRGVEVLALDRAARRVLTAEGSVPYDVLVLATGSAARVPDVEGLAAGPGGGLPRGVHALRTLDDARGVVAASTVARRAVVVGAGVLGLEVACGLARRGVPVSLVHGGPTLMDRQLATAAGDVVAASLAGLGVRTWTGARPRRVVVSDDGRVRSVVLDRPGGGDAGGAAGSTVEVAADLVVLCCGTVPEVGLARAAGLAVGRGVVVGPDLASPDDPRVHAIGDCAQPPEGGTGLVAQGWDQARRLVAALVARAAGTAQPGRAGDPAADDADRRDRPSMAVRLGGGLVSRAGEPAAAGAGVPAAAGTDVVRVKAHGLQVVAMGVCGARRRPDPAHRTLALADPAAGRYVEVVVADGVVVGATCVGAPDVGADLTAAYTRRTPVPADPAHLLLRAVGTAAAPAADPSRMPERAAVCHCNGVSKGDVVACWRDGGRTVDDVARATRASTGCGGCTDVVRGLLGWLATAEPTALTAAPAGA